MTMSNQLVRAATDPDGWRAGTVRVLANALLVLLAFEVVSLAVGVAEMLVTARTPPLPPVQFVLLAAVFLLVRWIFVLPALLPVLVGIEVLARRVPHARVLTAVIALAPMVLWELLVQGPGDVPSGQGVILGATAVLFAVLARLPARIHGRSREDQEADQPTTGAAPAPR
jgi:hypothetical protein